MSEENGRRNGDIAQLGERLPCTQEVSGSIPLISTNSSYLRLQAVSFCGNFAKQLGLVNLGMMNETKMFHCLMFFKKLETS